MRKAGAGLNHPSGNAGSPARVCGARPGSEWAPRPAPAPTPAPTLEPDPEPQDLPSPGPLLPSPGSRPTPLPKSPGQPVARTGHRVVLGAPTTTVPALQGAGAH